MNDSHPVVEFRISSRSFRWDTGLFVVVALGIVAFGFFFVEIRSGTVGEIDTYKQKVHVLLSVVNGALTLGAAGIWIHMNYVSKRSELCIKNGRIIGTVFNARDNRVNLEIDAIQVIGVEKDDEGRAISLSLEHKEGVLELLGFSNLDALLDVIRNCRQRINIRNKAPQSAWSWVLPQAAAFAAVLATAATIYTRYHPFESMTPFSMTLLNAVMIRLYLLKIFMISKQRKRNYQAVVKVLYLAVFAFALLTLATCVVISSE